MKRLVVLSALAASCAPPPPAATVDLPAASAASPPAAPEAPSGGWKRRPKTLGMRTPIEGPLVVRADGSSSLGAARDVVRVSDQYSACFVTKKAEVRCWGIMSGGTWNGIAKKDTDVDLHGVVDVAILQTEACALTKDGAVQCWTGAGSPTKQDLPGASREIAMSVSGRSCALLEDGAVWTSRTGPGGPWERVRFESRAKAAHLLACDRTLVCGELDGGGAMCSASDDPDDPRRGLHDKQRQVAQRIHAAPPGMRLAMDDTGSAYCAYSDSEIRCFDASSGTSSTITELQGITEVGVGWSTLGKKRPDTTGCARIANDGTRCWDLAEAKPALVSP